MYYPYFRGKQYELITIRENAVLMAESGFVPIIEPVKESLSGLEKAVHTVREAGGRVVLIVNPTVGDFKNGAMDIENYAEELPTDAGVTIGVILHGDLSVGDAVNLCDRYEAQGIALIHRGYPDARELKSRLGEQRVTSMTHVFIESQCTKLYRRRFPEGTRVLIRDGFQRGKNSAYPEMEAFSDLHITFREEHVTAFGDFLIVGEEYIEGGGPAYAVAIHLTFIDPVLDEEMWIHHFKSDRSETPQDPAGKFMEALEKLVAEVDRDGNSVRATSAVGRYRELHEQGHFPGLGYIKKLSMNHHIETLAHYLERANGDR